MKYLLIVILMAGSARADEWPPKKDEPEKPEKPAEPPKPDPVTAELVGRINALEKRLKKVEEDLDLAKDDNKALGDQVQMLLPLQAKFSGYVDIGFFATTGNGAGTRSDLTGQYYPGYASATTCPNDITAHSSPLTRFVSSARDPSWGMVSATKTIAQVHRRW